MKDIFKKIFDNKIITPLFIAFGVFAILEFIVFPSLTMANTFLNIVGTFVFIFMGLFVFYYIKALIIPTEPGETELDYINPDEIKVKKKPAKKKKTKSEFPMPPHQTTIKNK